MRRPRLLDLFCGAGGSARGYQMAGFHVTGVDCRPQPRYAGDVFVRADALDFLAEHGREFDAIHASPPCQRYSALSRCRPGNVHPDLVAPARTLLQAARPPWVIENVMQAPLRRGSTVLCGLMFGLRVFRHRVFESSSLLMAPHHPTHRGHRIGVAGMVCVAGYGSANRAGRARTPADHRDKASWVRGMAIDWMTRDELSQAIPPAYTHYIGLQLRTVLDIMRG